MASMCKAIRVHKGQFICSANLTAFLCIEKHGTTCQYSQVFIIQIIAKILQESSRLNHSSSNFYEFGVNGRPRLHHEVYHIVH